METTYRATTPVSSPQHCSTWPCAKPRQRLFRLFCKQAVQHYCPKCASQLCTVPSHVPLYVFSRSRIVRHVVFRIQRSSQASHPQGAPALLRQQPQLIPQCPKCFHGVQYRNVLDFSHFLQYQLYQYGLHFEHSQIVSKSCAPT